MYASGPEKIIMASASGLAASRFQCGLGRARWHSTTSVSPFRRVTVGRCVAVRPSESWLMNAANGFACISDNTSAGSVILNCSGTNMRAPQRGCGERERAAIAVLPPNASHPIVIALVAIGLPERPRNFMLDLGAAEADVAQQPVVELAEMAALSGAVEPNESSIEEARGKTAISLGARGTHEVGTRFVVRIVPIHLAISSIRNVRLSQLPP